MLRVDGDYLIYELSAFEVMGAFHRSPKSKLTGVTEFKVVQNPWSREVLRGLRAPGTGFPYLIMLGTMRHRAGKDFCVIYKRRPVIVIEFKEQEFKRWVVPATVENQTLLEKLGSRQV